MSWRKGSALFLKIWPQIQKHIADPEHRVEFTADLLKVFEDHDMDTWEVEDQHPEIRAALKQAGFELQEPERYRDD